AAGWYRQAAVQGHVEAQHRLGFCYENGIGVEKDAQQAVEWYRQAAIQGHAEAQYKMGSSYSNGNGVAKNDEEAAEWYRKAAEQEHSTAQYLMPFYSSHPVPSFNSSSLSSHASKSGNTVESKQKNE